MEDTNFCEKTKFITDANISLSYGVKKHFMWKKQNDLLKLLESYAQSPGKTNIFT